MISYFRIGSPSMRDRAESTQGVKNHILFVVNTYPPRMGGLEKLVRGLAVNTAALGHRVSVVTLADNASDTIEDGVRVIRLVGRFPIASVISFPSMGTTRRIAKEFADKGVTAVSMHTRFFPMSFVGLRVARKLRVPSIHTEHGSDYVRGVSPLVWLASRLVDHTMGSLILRRSDRVLAESEPVSDFVRRLAGVESEILYNAVDLPSDMPDPVLPERSFVFVGRIVPGKGWDDLLKAAALLSADPGVEPFTIELLGDGPQMDEMRTLIQRLKLEGITRVHGFVSSKEVNRALRGSIFVNPSRLSEGFQTSMLESLAAGSQIVTYDVPGARRLAKDGAPVRIADRESLSSLVDAMKESLTDPLPAFPPEDLAQWGWPQRTKEFLEILGATTIRAR